MVTCTSGWYLSNPDSPLREAMTDRTWIVDTPHYYDDLEDSNTVRRNVLVYPVDREVQRRPTHDPTKSSLSSNNRTIFLRLVKIPKLLLNNITTKKSHLLHHSHHTNHRSTRGNQWIQNVRHINIAYLGQTIVILHWH